MNKIRKIFDVYIGKKQYPVYDIDGKEHEGYNNMPKTWWLYYADKMPEGLLPSPDSDELKPFDKGINRRCWDIRLKQSNSTKVKWDELRFNNHTSVEMWCNEKLIYSFGTSGTDYGLAFAFGKVQYLMVVLQEHCFNFFDPMSENGRKICWYGLPAFVRVSEYDSWEIKIVPDYSVLPKEKWWIELKRRESKYSSDDDGNYRLIEEEDFNESMESDYINWGDALSDQHIYWFRK